MTSKISKYQQKQLRNLAREKLGLPINASIKRIIKELGSEEVNEQIFYVKMLKFKKADQQQKEEESRKKMINEMIIKTNKKIKESIQKEKERKEKAKAKRQEKKQDRELNEFKKSIVVDIKSKILTNNELENFVDKVAEKLTTNNLYYVQLSVDGEIIKNELFTTNSKSLWSKAWEILKKVLCNISEGSDISNKECYIINNNYKKFHLIISTDDKIPSERLQQKYRDGGVFHCVFDVFSKELQNKYEATDNENTRKRIKQQLNKLDKIRPEYEEGVPEEKMEEICSYAGFKVSIKNLLNDTIMQFNQKGNKKLEFTNTRKNHIDLNNLTWDTKPNFINNEEMYKKVEQIKNGETFGLVNSFNSPTSIKTLDGNFCVVNDSYEIFKEFNEETGINNYKLNSTKYPELNEFIKEGRIINSAPVEFFDGNNINEETKHLDLVKAYTQHKNCRLYQGFPAFITNWSKGSFDLNFIKNHIGIYKFKVIENKNEMLKQLGIFEKYSYILPSVEIIDFIENGVIVEILAGCWGTTFDFEYNEEMLENRNYAIWAGKLGQEHKDQVYMVKGDKEWASHLKSELGEENIKYFEKEKTIIIKKENDKLYTLHHILAFITSYTRINMLDVMRGINGTIKKVILDGVYFDGEYNTIIPHKIKELKEHLYFVNGWYEPTEINTDKWSNFDERFVENNIILAGAGGTGKSYSVFNSKNLTDILYVVPTHQLGKNAGKNYTTIHSLIGEGVKDNRIFKDIFYYPSTIFIDELTMIEEEWIKRALKLYPQSKFIIGGDVDSWGRWFQTRNGHSGNFSKLFIPKGTKAINFNNLEYWNYIYYENDYRSLDNELKELKLKIRDEMRRIFTNGEVVDNMKMINYIKSIMPTIKLEDAMNKHEDGNIWICGTHEVRNKLKAKNILNSFTCHSFQGSTIEKEKVFITLDTFEYAMLYTAISRVRNFNQLIVVD